MTRRFLPVLPALLFLVAGGSRTIAAPPSVDALAPGFTLPDIDGKKHSLSDFKGKFVVLEWVNYDCPFVRKHYNSGNMQRLQKTYRDKDVVWLSICSSAPGKQGFFGAEDLRERMKEVAATPTAYLMDPDGSVGKLYEAKTTPDMFIINPEGVLVYAGAIDDKPSTDTDDIGKASNYVRAALDAAMAGKAVPTKSTKSYGCSVKYK